MIILGFENAVVALLWSMAALSLLTLVSSLLLKSKRKLIAVLSDIALLSTIGYFTVTQFSFMQANFSLQLMVLGILILLLVIVLIRDVRNYVKEIEQNQIKTQ